MERKRISGKEERSVLERMSCMSVNNVAFYSHHNTVGGQSFTSPPDVISTYCCVWSEYLFDG